MGAHGAAAGTGARAADRLQPAALRWTSELSASEGAQSSPELTQDNTGSEFYEYDLFNRLIRYEKGDITAVYTYNGDGQRQSKTVNGVVTHFVWDGMNMVYEYTDAESSSYIYGTTGILYRKDSAGEVYTYTTSGRGDVVTVADSDGNAREYFYNAYGEIFRAFGAEPENPLLYCGEYADRESGLIYLRNRYYDPTQGRFITEDPVRDGTNWYVYCENNPVMYVDLWGLAGEMLSEPEQYEYQFGEYMALRFNAERWGADVSYNGRTRKATIKFPNRSAVSFKVGEEGTYIDNNGTMQVKSSVFKKKTKITQVYSKKVRDKTLTLVSFQKGKNVNLVWDGYTIGNIQVSGRIRNTSTVPTDKLDKIMYERFGNSGVSTSMALGDTLHDVHPYAGAAYDIITSYHDPFAGVDFSVSLADTKLRINDENQLYRYITVFLAAKGDSITYVGATYGGI